MKKKPIALLALLCCLLLSIPAFATISITGLKYASANSTCDGEIEVTVTGNAGPFQFGGRLTVIQKEIFRELSKCSDFNLRRLGSYANRALIHEIGHQIGLTHKSNTFMTPRISSFTWDILPIQRHALRCRKASPQIGN